MKRQPLKAKTGGTRSQISTVKTRQAPVLGWNARDSLANMKPGYAIKLVNWYPTPGDCVVRSGNVSHKTGFGTAEVDTLAVYNALNGTSKLFASTSAGIYDATSAGAVGAAVLARTNGRSQYVNYGDGTTNWLIMVNGVDKPAYYSGSAWLAVDAVTSPALTGIGSDKLVHVNAYKGRLFFIEVNSLSVWYLAAGAAGGALTEFDFSSILSKGGYLQWMATWTRDGGSGPDDYAVFMSSEGQVAVYTGNNPSSSTTWSLVGVYEIGRPLGRRSYVEMDGDIVIITENGIFPLSVALQTVEKNNRSAITNIIDGAFNDAAKLYGNLFGWEAILYPRESALVCNVPHGGDMAEQFVMNTITRAWCSFDSWNANCFAVMNGLLYFGMKGAVRLAWSGESDMGANIVAEGKTAFDYMDAGGGTKRFGMFRPVLSANGSITFLTDIDVDFRDDDISGVASYTSGSTSFYGTAIYGTSLYGGGLEIVREWTSPNENVGFCAAGKVKIATKSLEIHWMANDYAFETGGVL